MTRLKFYYHFKKIILFCPAPIFFVAAIYSYLFGGHSICGWSNHISEMTVMWLLMAISHMRPWI